MQSEITQDEKEKEKEQAKAEDKQANPDVLAKANELSKKLGVPVEDGDSLLSSKREIAQVMVQRAVSAGKSQAEIKKALTG